MAIVCILYCDRQLWRWVAEAATASLAVSHRTARVHPMTCSNCGALLPLTTPFCPHCGQPQGAANPASATMRFRTQATQGNVHRAKSGWTMKVRAISGLLIAISGLIGAVVLAENAFTSSGPAIPPAAHATATSQSNGGIPTSPVLQVGNPSTSPTSGSDQGWDVKSAGGIPSAGTEDDEYLTAGQLLMLTGGVFRFGDAYCAGGGKSLCVLIIHASRSQNIHLTALYPGANWVGISSSLTTAEALQLQEPQFWQPDNCPPGGCSSAQIYLFEDQTSASTCTLTPSSQGTCPANM